MELHEALTELAAEQGDAPFADGQTFKGVLDDYLDEDTASRGTINLLADAVGLGALDALVTMLDSGATPESAVETAGRRLARDRGSADVVGSQWAVAILGYALARVPLELAQRLESGGAGAVQETYDAPPPPAAPPTEAGWELPGVGGDYTNVVPRQPELATAAPPEHPPPGRAKRPPVGLVVGIVAAVVVLLVGGLVAGLVLSGGNDEEPGAGGTDDTSATSEPSEASEPTGSATSYDVGVTVSGTGYAYNLPDAWTLVTDQVPRTPATRNVDTVAAWGDDLTTARSNIIVERASADGADDPAELADAWKGELERGAGTAPVDAEPAEIDGEEAVGVKLEYTNANDVPIRQLGYLVVRDGHQYSIAVTIVDGDRQAEPVFRSALASWQWVS